MSDPLRLMCVLAHPDDESLGVGGTLARYAAEGIDCCLVTATRGERGWFGPEDENPGLLSLGQLREAELRNAAQMLGLSEVRFLDFIDGELDQADPALAIQRIVHQIRRIRPQVVITFPPDGTYGHPDHIAISQLTAGALVCAADSSYTDPAGQAAHTVAKFYYAVDSQNVVGIVRQVLGGISMEIDGVERQHLAWEDWAITTRIDATAHWRTAWQACLCHKSQLPGLGPFDQLTDELHLRLWGTGNFYRAYSLVSGGRQVETDLFAGLR